MTKTIKIKIDGKLITFNVTVSTYDKYLNELQPGNKVAPARNFLLRTVAAEDREDLKSMLEKPSVGLQVASKLVEEFTPDIEIELGE